MGKFRIIVVDRTRSPFLKEGEAFYLKRISRYATVEWVEVKAARITKSRPREEVLALEADRIVRRIGDRDYLVALDSGGDPVDSEGLAAWLERRTARSQGAITFVIGGPLGLSSRILDRSRKILSLSRLTLTHEMARLVFLEQIYRAFTIIRGEKYHK
ncbi:MAG: 23S rRNA (pseudouridine(1915)-N(3))-methyltransferase RlmH [Deltaproteobacteria bacterium]|nr:23S rRNA (pseudouridine(1915)-N(3))-methyltransferase RlmH [Deltaproteobacteria bacterium]